MKLKLLSLLTGVLLCGLLTGTEKELDFTKIVPTLKSWQKEMIGVDHKVTLGGKPSIHLRKRGILTQTFELEKGARYELSYFVKGRNVEAGDLKGTLVMLNAGRRWSRITATENKQPDSGTFDWRKGKGIIDCAAFGENKVKILLAIRGGGEAWYSNIRLKKLPPSAKQIEAKKISFNIKFFPAFLDGNRISFCENLPGMLEIVSNGKADLYKGKKGFLTIQTPSYVKLLSACETFTLSRKRRRIPTPFTASSVVRDGKKYNKYVIPYNSVMLSWINMSWYRHILYFEIAPRSAGKTDKIYYSAQIGNEVQKEQALALKILPSVKFPEKPCKEFSMWINKMQSCYVPVKKISGSYIKFWTSLSQKCYTATSYRDRDIPIPGFEQTVGLGGALLYNILIHKEHDAAKKYFPKNVTDKGKVDHRNQVSVWALLDDAEGHYERYTRDILRKLKAYYGEIKHLWWDFEPHPWGYDEGGRKRFAKKMGLKKVPTVAEINKHYSEQWFDYMVKLHAEFVAKTVKIIREELPGTKFWYCSDNLHAVGPRLARWCGIDVSLSDDIVDIHNHMPYYASTRYYDDMAYNVASLKKPYFPLIDPAERLKSFYSQYSGPKVMQNIVATAALGGMGIGFWPDDVLQGEYYHGIAKGFSLVAQGEEFYRKGVRCDKEFKLAARNVVSRRLANGKVITYPDFSNAIRYTVHRLKGKHLVTLFNYDPARTLIAEVTSKKVKPFLVKVPASGCVLVDCDRIPAQSTLKQEISRFGGDSSIFRDQQKANKAIRWNSTGKGVPVLEMINGNLIAGVDAFGQCHVATFRTADQKEYFHNGFAGRLTFNDPSLGRLQFKRTSHGFAGKDNIPFVEVGALIPQYTGGASSVVHPLYGMTIRRRMELHKDRLVVIHTFVNNSRKNIKLDCRLSNYPYVGYRFKAENVLLWNYDRTSPMNVYINRRIKKGENIVLKGVSGVLSESVTFIPGEDYEGLFIWTLKGGAPRKTVEFTVNKVVKPGETLVRSYSVAVEK